MIKGFLRTSKSIKSYTFSLYSRKCIWSGGGNPSMFQFAMTHIHLKLKSIYENSSFNYQDPSYMCAQGTVNEDEVGSLKMGNKRKVSITPLDNRRNNLERTFLKEPLTQLSMKSCWVWTSPMKGDFTSNYG